jgi:hypothetical protein
MKKKSQEKLSTDLRTMDLNFCVTNIYAKIKRLKIPLIAKIRYQGPSFPFNLKQLENWTMDKSFRC